MCAVDAKHRDAWSLRVWSDRGDRQIVPAVVERGDAPASGGRIAGQGDAQSPNDFAGVGCRGQSCMWGEGGAEESECASSAGNFGARDQFVDSDGPLRVWGRTVGGVEKPKCARDRTDREERVGLGQQLGGGAESEHAHMLWVAVGRWLTTPLRGVAFCCGGKTHHPPAAPC